MVHAEAFYSGCVQCCIQEAVQTLQARPGPCLAAVEVRMVMCTHNFTLAILQNLPQICSITNWALRLPHPITTPTLKLVHLPFLRVLACIHSASDVASKVIGSLHAHPSNLVDPIAPSLCLGKITSLNPWMAPTSVSTTTSGTPVKCCPQVIMGCTLAPSAATHAMVPTFAPETSLECILYIHTTPYVPSAWLDALPLPIC